MRKVYIRHGALAAISVFAVAIAVPVGVMAIPARAQEAQTAAQERKETAQTNAEERKAAAQTRLADAKLRACENREKAIQSILARIADRGTKQLDVFNKISERVQAFYVDKGRTLDNYDELVAEVDAKKADAEAAVETIKTTSVDFACDGEDPKGMISQFKESLKTEIAVLKDYKTAVKNLIVGVKSVQGTTSSSENSGSEE